MDYKTFLSKAPSDLKGAINHHCAYLLDVFYNGKFTRIEEQFKLECTADLNKDIDTWNREDWEIALDVIDELAQIEFEKRNNL